MDLFHRIAGAALDRFEAENDRHDPGRPVQERRLAAMQAAIAPFLMREAGGAAFRIGDAVETVKGAKFRGTIIAFDMDEASPGCTVLATDPAFAGTKHVYPLKQLALQATNGDSRAHVSPDGRQLQEIASHG